jgi:homopolymeric O-antigen transport system permease protein
VSSAAAHESQVTVIEPPKGASWPDWRELWSHRELLAVLARRDVSVRYKQSFMGALWSLVQPLSFAAVFSIFFDLLADIDTGTDVPYPVFAVLGMVTWLFFTGALVKVSESTVASATLISKVYFPRLVIPLAAVAAPTVDFVVGMVVALAVTLAYGVIPPVQVVLVPLMIPLVLAVTLGFGLWFAAVNVKYRDIGNLVSFIVLLGLFISPIVYPFSTVPSQYHVLYGLNPMVGVLELMRWMVLPGADFPTLLIFVPLVESAILTATGLLYFGRAQQSFADVI